MGPGNHPHALGIFQDRKTTVVSAADPPIQTHTSFGTGLTYEAESFRCTGSWWHYVVPNKSPGSAPFFYRLTVNATHFADRRLCVNENGLRL